MKKLAILTLLSGPAYAHQISPQTEFFKEELRKNPQTIQILNWCGLVGVNEEVCRAEMYGKGTGLSPEKLEAAKICVERSGLKHRAFLDRLSKSNADENALVSHQLIGAIWHLDYRIDPAEGKDAKPHRHFYTEEDYRAAENEMGAKYADQFKSGKVPDTTTAGSSLEGTASLGASSIVVSGEGSVTKGSETSATKGTYTQAELDKKVEEGRRVGRENPQLTSIVPHGGCYQTKGGEDCFTPKGAVAAIDTKPREEAKTPAPKPEAEKPKDFFAPILEGSSGSPKPSESPSSPKVDEKKKAEANDKIEKIKGTTLPIYDPDFTRRLHECVDRVEEELFNVLGIKYVDPNQLTEVEKKEKAESELRDGFCDAGYWGPDFCSVWQKDLDSTKAKTPLEIAAEKEAAMGEFQRAGYCDPHFLGEDFCRLASYALEITPAEESDDQPASDENPPTLVPGDHISVEGFYLGGEGNPAEGTPAD